MRLKKTAALALAAVMLTTSAALPAFATSTSMVATYDETTTTWTTKSGETTVTTPTTEVTYKVDATYEWTIPSKIDFGSNAGVGKTVVVATTKDTDSGDIINRDANTDSKVTVSKNVIPEGQKLVITAEGSGAEDSSNKKAFTITNTKSGAHETLSYTITCGESTNTLTPGGEIVSMNAGVNTQSVNLKFALKTKSSTDNTNLAEIAGTYEGTVTYTATVEDQTA